MDSILFRSVKKFKSSILTLRVIAPIEKETLNERAIIGPVLAASTKKYHSKSGLSRRLNWLYGTQFSVYTMKIGFQSVISFQFVYPNSAFLPNQESLLEPVVALLHEIIYRPLILDGHFPNTVVNDEVRLLKESLESEYNDKNEYAFQQFRQTMFDGETYSLRTKGDLSTLDRLSSHSLMEYYQEFLKQPMLISLVGDGEEAMIKHIISKYFTLKPLNDRYLWIDTEASLHACPIVKREENHITQSKLFIGYRTQVTFDQPLYLAMQLFNMMLGDSDQSLLFKTVRERDHLCYSIGSTYDSNKGMILISMGVDSTNEQKAIDAVKSVIADMQAGLFEDSWLSIAKSLQTRRIQQRNDSLVSLAHADFYYQIIHDAPFDMDTWIQKNSQITHSDIVYCANQLILDTTYTLAPKEEHHEVV